MSLSPQFSSQTFPQQYIPNLSLGQYNYTLLDQHNQLNQHNQHNQHDQLPTFESSTPSLQPTQSQCEPLLSSSDPIDPLNEALAQLKIAPTQHPNVISPNSPNHPLYTTPLPPPLPIPSIKLHELDPAKMLTALEIEKRTLNHLNLLYSSEIARLEHEATILIDLLTQTNPQLVQKLNITQPCIGNGIAAGSGTAFFEMYGKSLSQYDIASNAILQHITKATQQGTMMNTLLPQVQQQVNDSSAASFSTDLAPHDQSISHPPLDHNNMLHEANNTIHSLNTATSLSTSSTLPLAPQEYQYIPHIEIHDDTIGEQIFSDVQHHLDQASSNNAFSKNKAASADQLLQQQLLQYQQLQMFHQLQDHNRLQQNIQGDVNDEGQFHFEENEFDPMLSHQHSDNEDNGDDNDEENSHNHSNIRLSTEQRLLMEFQREMKQNNRPTQIGQESDQDDSDSIGEADVELEFDE